MLTTIAAMALLSSVILNVNKNSLTTTMNISETKYRILAVSMANTIIEEAMSKSFDENTTDNKLVSNTSQLSTLKADNGETSRLQFDDFDDFNNYVDSLQTDSTYDFTPMTIKCRVYYVDPYSSLDSVNYKTWYKRIKVSITSPFIGEGKEHITLSKINSHYYFR